MIKVSELMMGDWVYDRDTKRQFQVSLSTFRYCKDWDTFEPIPLTTELLLLNGFEGNENVKGYQYPNDDLIFCLEELSGVFIWRGLYNDVCIETVHMLQHILRLSGLIDLADNFKV